MAGLTDFRLSYELSPIILVGGSAQGVTGGMIPIINLLQSGDYAGLGSDANKVTGIDLGNATPGASPNGSYFAHFTPLPGGTLLEQQIPSWPLANQAVAANDQITQPLRISLLMVCPADPDVIGYVTKQSVMSTLQTTLAQHVGNGGWFNVATPSFIYQGCLLTALTDVTDVEAGGQVQISWRWDFVQPIITDQAAQAAQNQAMAKATSQTQVTGNPPLTNVPANVVGQPSSNLAPSMVPGAQSPVGSNVAPSNFSAKSLPDVSAVSPIAPGVS